jgi:hypothetical protein
MSSGTPAYVREMGYLVADLRLECQERIATSATNGAVVIWNIGVNVSKQGFRAARLSGLTLFKNVFSMIISAPLTASAGMGRIRTC